MVNKNHFKEERFDSFLNKTIMMSSRKYFLKQMNIIDKENTIVDNEDFSLFLQEFIELDSRFMTIEKIDTNIVLNCALSCLSDIEQAVIFLLFDKELSQDKASEVLNIWSKSVSRIKIRAIAKLKKYLEGDM